MDNKDKIRQEFFINQLKNKAKSKLLFRDYVFLCELLEKIKDIKRNNNSD
jgi:hypothetical protein